MMLSAVMGTDIDVISRPIEEEVDKQLLQLAMNRLTNREKLIMELRFGIDNGEEKTQKEVADRLGISQSYISRLEKRIIRRLRKEFSRLE